jgi:hypothetical protein
MCRHGRWPWGSRRASSATGVRPTPERPRDRSGPARSRRPEVTPHCTHFGGLGAGAPPGRGLRSYRSCDAPRHSLFSRTMIRNNRISCWTSYAN